MFSNSRSVPRCCIKARAQNTQQSQTKFRKNVKCTIQDLTSEPKNKVNLPNMPGRVSLSPRHFLFVRVPLFRSLFLGGRVSLPRRPSVFQNIFCTEEFLFTFSVLKTFSVLCREDLFLSSRYFQSGPVPLSRRLLHVQKSFLSRGLSLFGRLSLSSRHFLSAPEEFLCSEDVYMQDIYCPEEFL